MIVILIFGLISIVMLLIAYYISKNNKLKSELTLQQYVEQISRNKKTIIIFTLFTFLGGGMILDPKSRKIIGLALFLNITMGVYGFIIVVGFSNSIMHLTLSGERLIALLIILPILWYRVSMLIKYINVIDNYQKIANFVLKSINDKLKQQQLDEEKKYTSEKFIAEVKKIYKLKENDIITNEEYIIRFDSLLEDLKKIGIKENKEDFIVGIITLKENGIIDNDVLSKIKNIVHPSVIRNTENSIKDNSSQVMNNLKYNSNKLVNELTRIFDFKNSGLYTEEEFSKRKIDIIINLINKGITENIEDFLVKIIPLKERGILNLEDITQIKSSLTEKAKAENEDVMNEASSLYFVVESSIDEIKEVLLNYIENSNGKLKKNEQFEIIASYGSKIKTCILGILGGIDIFSRDVVLSLQNLDNKIAIQITIIDTSGFCTRSIRSKNIKNMLKELFNEQALEIKSIIEGVTKKNR